MLKRGQPQRVRTLARWGLEALDARRGARDRARPSCASRCSKPRPTRPTGSGSAKSSARWLDQLSDLDLDAGASTRASSAASTCCTAATRRARASTGSRAACCATPSSWRGAPSVGRARERGAAPPGGGAGHVGELAEARELARARARAAPRTTRSARSRWLQLGADRAARRRASRKPCAAPTARCALLRASATGSCPAIVRRGAHAARPHLPRRRPARGAPSASMQHAVRLARQAGERRARGRGDGAPGRPVARRRPRRRTPKRGCARRCCIAREIEDRRGETLAGLWLGILLWEQDDPDARSQIERVVRQAREIGLGRVEALALAIRARIAPRPPRSWRPPPPTASARPS